jgi:hypothetical protein
MLLLFSTGLRAQKKAPNALLYPNVVISDVIPLDSTYYIGFGFARKFHMQSFNRINYKEGLSLNTLLVEKITHPATIVYENFSPYNDVYFNKYDEIFSRIPLEQIKRILGEYSDTIIQVDDEGELKKKVTHHAPDTNEVKGLLFFDEWFFDEKAFTLIKKVLAYCPIRKYARNIYEEEDGWAFRKIGYFVFPELKKRQLKKVEKRMRHIARVKYEYPIENRHFFNKPDTEMALYTEDYDSPNWNSYARLKFRNLLINRALSGKSRVCDFNSKKALDLPEIKKRLGYTYEKLVQVDPETGKEKAIEYETDIIREDIKSVIFVEDWFIDYKSMRMKKEIIGIALVRYYDNEEYTKKLKRIAFIIYFDKNKK